VDVTSPFTSTKLSPLDLIQSVYVSIAVDFTQAGSSSSRFWFAFCSPVAWSASASVPVAPVSSGWVSPSLLPPDPVRSVSSFGSLTVSPS